MADEGTRRQQETVTKPRDEVKPPRLHKVLLHNDDFTTQDFVVAVLQTVFKKPRLEAVKIMLSVHHQGIGVAGVYPAEIAETKVATVHTLARDNGFPLKCSMEPE